jgi:predicted NodU family carbamoyl transferase
MIDSIEQCTFKNNLHCGLDSDIRAQLLSYSDADIAAATQVITERLIDSVMLRAHNIGWSDNLVYTGGVAMNGLANKNLGNHFTRWSIPRWCGDAGSSIGACALAHGGKITYNY